MRRLAERSVVAALVLSCVAGSALAQSVFLSETEIVAASNARFGGLSAIEMDVDGRGAVVLSDRGTLFDLTLARDRDRISDVSMCCATPLTDARGGVFAAFARDSEGLARLPDGTLLISFERGQFARVAVHGTNGQQRNVLPAVPGVDALPDNGAFEAVAVDARGGIYTVPESMPGQGPIPLLRYDGSRWQRFADLPRQGGWSPVALDFDDRGRLFLLERYGSMFGFASRLTRFDIGPGGITAAREMLKLPSGPMAI